MSGERPRGRDSAVGALVRAARELFAERGPAAVSLRDIAKRAGVSHGLIHHYIGSRDDLLRLVFETSTEHATSEVLQAGDPVAALRNLRSVGGTSSDYTRMLAWAVLEGHDPTEFHGRSSALDAVVGIAGDSREVRVALAMAMVQTLGWKLFGGYALNAAGLDGEDAEAIRQEVDTLVDQLVQRATDSTKARR